MSNLQARSLFRPIVLIVALIFVLSTWNRSGSSRDTMAEENQHAGALSKLALRIRQTSEKPPSLSFSVENKHDAPLTILRWNTPLDPLAIQVGLVSITPEGKSEPIEVHTVQLRRIMPPRPEDLVTLQPGESQEQEIILKEPIVALDSLGKTARVAVKGKWQVVWPTTADKLSQATLEKLQFGEGVLTGEFESETIDVTIG